MSKSLMTALKVFLSVTDIGFIVYWLVTLLHGIPTGWLFKDYSDPILVAWNWSFLPLDLLISLTGLSSLWMHRVGLPQWRTAVVISLTLTSVSGLMAVSFWTLRHDFDWEWWLPNVFLLIYPLVFLFKIDFAGRKV